MGPYWSGCCHPSRLRVACRLTPPSSGSAKGRFPPLVPPLMSNVRAHEPPQFSRLSLRALLIGVAVAPFAWRCSIDWSHMTPREVCDAAQNSLLVPLCALLIPKGLETRSHSHHWTPSTIAASIVATSLGGIHLFNGLLASKRLECRDRVVVEAAAASIPASFAAVSKCFEGSAIE